MSYTKYQKKQARRVIFAMTLEENWREDQQAVQKVQKLSEVIGSDSIADSKPLPKLDFDKLTRKNYLYMLQNGYLVRDIRKALGVGTARFGEWVRANRVRRYDIKEQNLSKMTFTDEDKKIPVLEGDHD